MKKIFAFLSAVLFAAMANAQTDHIEAAPLTLEAGQEGKISISLVNTERDYTQFYLDVVLPEGLAFCQYKKGRNMVWGEVSADRSNEHSLTSAFPDEENEQVRRFLVESSNNNDFYNEDEDGKPVAEILLCGIKAAEALAGDYTVKVTKVNFTALENGKGVNYVFDDIEVPVTVTGKGGTGIAAAVNAAGKTAACNIAGQRVGAGYKGLVIVGGKKVVW